MRITALAFTAAAASAQLSPQSKVLVVTGGHDFDANAFDGMWQSTGAQVERRALAVGHEVFADISDWDYDILVFYNHQNPGNSLADKHKQNFRALLEKGVGMFVLHHSVAAYPFFPEFEAMAGGKYRSSAYYQDNLSTYKIPVNINCKVNKADDPTAAGLPASFAVNDEIYLKMTFASDNNVIVTTDYPESDGPIAWTRKAGKSRVFTTILGNGSGIFSNTSFRTLVKNGLNHVLPCEDGDTRSECPTVALGLPGPSPQSSPSFRLLPGHEAGLRAGAFGFSVDGRAARIISLPELP